MHRIVGLTVTVVLGILASSAPVGATIDVVQSNACPLGAPRYFEDPPFTVTVDAASVVGEPPAQQANNTRSF